MVIFTFTRVTSKGSSLGYGSPHSQRMNWRLSMSIRAKIKDTSLLYQYGVSGHSGAQKGPSLGWILTLLANIELLKRLRIKHIILILQIWTNGHLEHFQVLHLVKALVIHLDWTRVVMFIGVEIKESKILLRRNSLSGQSETQKKKKIHLVKFLLGLHRLN